MCTFCTLNVSNNNEREREKIFGYLCARQTCGRSFPPTWLHFHCDLRCSWFSIRAVNCTHLKTSENWVFNIQFWFNCIVCMVHMMRNYSDCFTQSLILPQKYRCHLWLGCSWTDIRYWGRTHCSRWPSKLCSDFHPSWKKYIEITAATSQHRADFFNVHLTWKK